MITGFNTDVKHKSKVYHVQTEDKGRKNPKIETLVYMGGEILDSHRTTYDSDRELLSEDEIVNLMESQHKKVIKSIKIGKYDTGEDDAVDFLTDRDFDDVITQYLSTEMPNDQILLEVEDASDIKRGASNALTVNVKTAARKPINGASVKIKLVSTAHRPRLLSRGETNKEGFFNAEFDIPPLKGDEFAILIQASSDFGTAEYRQTV